MSNLIPEPMTHAQFVEVLRDLLARVESHDSFEGNIEYLLPYPGSEAEEVALKGVDFMVRGTYRVGNSMGQGGVRMIGTVPKM